MQRKIRRIISFTIAALIAVVVICNLIVFLNTKGRNYTNIDEIPATNVGLVLGTSPITPRGIHNGSFDNRIKAASELYRAGKVKKLIVSGGDYTSTEKYGCDEPKAMRDSLIAQGVKAEDILMDYEGTTTIKSIAKMRFSGLAEDTITLISQGYHNPRALMMADRYEVPSIAFSAEIPPSRLYKVKNLARESLARVKMFFTLYLQHQYRADDFTYPYTHAKDD